MKKSLKTRLIVGMHDSVQRSAERGVGNGKDIQGIESLILTVQEMMIIGSGSGHTVILDEERSFDILNVSVSDPVIMSDVSIEPGTYHELRLVLKDELWVYYNKYRNISDMDDGELKWQEFIKRGFLSPDPYQEPSGDNDQMLVYHQHPNFYTSFLRFNSKPYYIPTVNSTMRQKYGSKNYQFGPVNTYHMEGSFRTRISIINSQDPNNHVWEGYSIKDFSNENEWPPERFK